MKCVDCGHEQSVGSFCGLCGGKLVANEGAAESSVTEDASLVDDAVKESAKGQADTYELDSHDGSTENEPTQGQQDESYAHTEYVDTGGTTDAAHDAYSEQASADEQAQFGGQQQGTYDQQASGGQSSESLDRVVETSKEFGSFFQQFMKTPSQALQLGLQQFSHAIINLAILAIVFSVTIFRMTKVDISSPLFEHGANAFHAFITIAVSMVIVIAVMFALNKLFGDESISFNQVVAIYGVFMVPAVIVGLISLVFAIIKNTEYAGHFLAILFLLVVLIIPLYMAGYFVMNFRKNIDPLYAYLLYTVASIVALALVHGIILDSVTGDFVQSMYALLTSLIYFLIG